MFHVQFVAHEREKMLKGLNNNSFSMESLLAGGGGGGGGVDTDNSESKATNEEDVIVRCLKNRVCSNCGRMDCNLLQCCNRVLAGGGDGIIKDNKPVLKFSVSAILGNEQPTNRNVQNGEHPEKRTLVTNDTKFYKIFKKKIESQLVNLVYT